MTMTTTRFSATSTSAAKPDDTLYALRYRTAGSATDADGDLDPPREADDLVEHARATPLADVGLPHTHTRWSSATGSWPRTRRGPGAARRSRSSAAASAPSTASRRRSGHGAVHRRPPRRRRARGAERGAERRGHRGWRRLRPGARSRLARIRGRGRGRRRRARRARTSSSPRTAFTTTRPRRPSSTRSGGTAARPGRYAVVALEKRFASRPSRARSSRTAPDWVRGALAGTLRSAWPCRREPGLRPRRRTWSRVRRRLASRARRLFCVDFVHAGHSASSCSMRRGERQVAVHEQQGRRQAARMAQQGAR